MDHHATMPDLPAWLPLTPDALRAALAQSQSAPTMSDETRAAVALLVRR